MKLRCLLVYPPFPMTYWGAEHALALTAKKSVLPPLGLLTVAALLPGDWEIRLCDMNVRSLTEDDWTFAEIVMLSGMLIQREALEALAREGRARGKPVVAGGAYASTSPEALAPFVDCVVVGEAEDLVASLAASLEGRQPLPARLEAAARPDLSASPLPRYDLLDPEAYQSIGAQWSRGCPFQCEFCDVINLFGRKPRTKTPAQLCAELAAIYRTGFRGSVFIVDDNFIGHKNETRRLLPEVAAFMRTHGDPFDLYTEASVNLAADPALVEGMVEAGFTAVFLGIETPTPETLRATKKTQNASIDLTSAIHTLTRAGLEVMGGFILGFDGDGPTSAEVLRQWIASVPVPLAMVGLLTALPGTALATRLAQEGRLRTLSAGDQFCRPNFEPRLDEPLLLAGYAALMRALYEPDAYYQRALASLQACPRPRSRFGFPLGHGLACLGRSLWHQGVRGAYRAAYWRFMGAVLRHAPRRISRAIGLAICGEHMIRYTHEVVLPRLAAAQAALAEARRPRTRAARPSEVDGTKGPRRSSQLSQVEEQDLAGGAMAS